MVYKTTGYDSEDINLPAPDPVAPELPEYARWRLVAATTTYIPDPHGVRYEFMRYTWTWVLE